MPRRNLLALVTMTLVALLCYQRVQKNPYARPLANAMSMIENQYLEPLPAESLFEGAMRGIIGKLDEHSSYISPTELQGFQETIDQQFTGVGMSLALDPQTKQLTVLGPLVGSPAYKAGVRAGDQLLRISGDSTQGMSLQEAVQLLRGKAGEAVTLAVLHEGETKPAEMKIVREIIHVNSVLGDAHSADGSWNFFLGGHDRIGYVRISSFTDTTAGELEHALDWLSQHDMRGLVLDLRDDPGGYLDAAVDVCDLLIDSGVIVTTRGRDGRISRTYVASGKGRFTDFPVAVLVNQQSASAAEIVAACLQDHHRAVIVGQRSYGKGTVQKLIDLEKDCGAMKLTTASYWRPSGKNIHRPPNAGANADWGVSPDQRGKVDLAADEQNRWRAWRAHRDLFSSPAANGNGKKPAKPFVDQPLLRAVEIVEKDASAKR
jgi:carboxyl-terminal processing protease